MFLASFLGAAVFFSGHFLFEKALGLRGAPLLRLSPPAVEGTAARRVAARFGGTATIYLVAVVLFAAFARADEPLTSQVRTAPEMPAALAGVQDGDRVLAVDGVAVSRFDELRDRIAARTGETVELTLDRAGAQIVLRLQPDESGRVGLIPAGETVPIPFSEAVSFGLTAPFEVMSQTAQVLIPLLSGTLPVETVGGPVAILDAASRTPGMPLWIVAHHLSLAWPLFLVFTVAVSAIAEARLRRSAPQVTAQ